jgi:ElaB/YqjD/DUF883 family membrane-anchored ribosome-binding protein
MAHRADDLRHDIEDTRAAMTEKLAMLEEHVRETVAGAQASAEEIVEDVGGIVKDVKGTMKDVREIVEDVGGIVEDVKTTVDTTLAAVRQGVAGAQASVEAIVENVKGTVEDTIATAQRTFDLPSQVEQHPWPMFGGALLVGYMLGSRGGGHTSAAGSTRDAQSARPQPQQGIISGIRDQFKDEIVSLRIIAVRAVMSTLCEMFKPAIPTVAPHLESALSKRGGQPIDSPEQHPASMSRAAANGVPS